MKPIEKKKVPTPSIEHFHPPHLPASSSTMSDPTSPSPSTDGIAHPRPAADLDGHNRTGSAGGIIRRSWVAMTDMLTPFSPAALASLPKNLKTTPKYTRADRIPETEADDEGNMPTVRDYHAINSLPPQVRVPKKIATPIKVEAKVWFANERSAYFLKGRVDQMVH